MKNREWKIGDTCVMFTNKAKGYTAEYTVENFDGIYYGIRRGAYYHRVSPNRIFPSREDALASLAPNDSHERTDADIITDDTDEEISQELQM